MFQLKLSKATIAILHNKLFKSTLPAQQTFAYVKIFFPQGFWS
jgi:hypothetical protein